MSQIVMICGLPASGKTELAKQIVSETQAELFDDLASNDIPDLVNSVQAGRKVVITDPNFCHTNVRSLAQSLLIGLGVQAEEISWIFFENDKQACLRNMVRRDGPYTGPGSIKPDIDGLATIYQVPADAADVRRVWSKE